MKKTILFVYIALITLYTQLNAQNINKPNIIGPAGLKVNSYSGSLFYQRTDLVIPGRGPSIDLTFYYNSATTAIDYGYGPGWSMTYSMKYIPEGNKVIIRRADGRKDVFMKSLIGYVAPVGIFDTLVNYMPGKFMLTTKAGTKYFFDDSLHKRLTKISDPNNNSLTVSYTDSLPATITDASGRSISMSYTNGRLIQVTDANTIPPRTIKYQYDANGNPNQVINVLGDTLKYQFDLVSNMIKLTGQLMNPVNISYNNCVNVMSISSSLNSLNFSYDTAQIKTTVGEVVNSVLQSTSYKYDLLGNIKEKIGNCCGYHQLYEYDAAKNIITKTDANGNVWHYAHDAKGNTTIETDPLGGSIIYTYEPVYNQVKSFKDKNGNFTYYNYDANGNLIKVNKPLTITEHYSYDINGNMHTHADGKGFITIYDYNAHGDKTAIHYPDGTTNSFTYDDVGNRLTATDANGNTTSYQYDLLNQLIRTTDALGDATVYAYDKRNDLISVTDALGHTTTYMYDALQRRTNIINPAGTAHYFYDEHGNLITSYDNNGNVTHYGYDTRNRLISQTNAVGNTHSFTYDFNGNKTSETDYNGNATTYGYDANNRLTRATDALMYKTEFSYDANGNRTSVKDANLHTTTNVYDALNRLTETHFPMGTTTHYSYDENSNRTSVTDANGHITIYNYDSRNRTTIMTDALSHSTTYNYDPEGNRIKVTDRNGHLSTYTYDALNRNITQTNPTGETTTTTYDAVGRTSSRTLPTGNITSYLYDASDRVISAADNLGMLMAYAYDANSNRLSQTDGNGNTTHYEYDSLNRTRAITDPLGFSRIYHYDNNSNVISEQDRNGHLTHYNYDVLERKISTQYPVGNSTSIAYDAVGNTVSRTDDNGHATTYLYDANDRLIIENYADGSAKHYSYDAGGNAILRTDNNGNTTGYSYDALDRLTTRDYLGSNDDNFSYDSEGKMLSANNSNAIITFTYDNAGRKLSENMIGKTTSYFYDIPNKRRMLTYPGGRNVEENYDNRMRLSEIKESAVPMTNYTYDAADRIITRSFRNGVVTNYTYNNNNRVTRLSHNGSSLIAQFNYDFDNEGNRLSAEKNHHASNSEKYLYDANDRLINYKEGTLIGNDIPAPLTQTQYNYDGVGNRISILHDAITTTYAANTVNEYTNVTDTVNTTPAYDANGNTLFDGRHYYQYDYENRLIVVDGGTTAYYKYDALGRRIQKVTVAGTINYYYDGNRIIEERSTDSTKATYVYGTWIDDILNMERNGSDYYYHPDDLGSITAVTDSSGDAVERYDYDPYGKQVIYNGSYSLIAATAIGNTYMFTGREYDSETDNYHYRARFYKPDWGRFGQWDPYEKSSGTSNLGNQYIYASNNPINHTDSKGTDNDNDKLKKWAEDQINKAIEEAKEKAKEKLKEKCKEKIVDAIGEAATETAGIFIDYTKFELQTAKAIIDAGGKIANHHSACLLCKYEEEKHTDGKTWVGGTIEIWSWNVWRFGFNDYMVLCKEVNGQLYATVPNGDGNDMWVPCW